MEAIEGRKRETKEEEEERRGKESRRGGRTKPQHLDCGTALRRLWSKFIDSRVVQDARVRSGSAHGSTRYLAARTGLGLLHLGSAVLVPPGSRQVLFVRLPQVASGHRPREGASVAERRGIYPFTIHEHVSK
ncbi:hypothetical protein E2C01_007488 [Portunus trituberculatus]|uniref:Uncharacterized protein n=1 Tax=Portunus trituberculatus TaxID=210409 RepID=A0A5B7CY17_PORTR|nr:hypothetical protein [Portunus trituberculatus]